MCHVFHQSLDQPTGQQLSSDDTSVAVLEKHDDPSPSSPTATLHFHEKITSNNAIYKGIHPLNAAESHQIHLPNLIQRALQHLPPTNDNDPLNTFPDPSTLHAHNLPTRRLKPTFITATRGPGMRSSLATGLDTAKGLSITLGIPLVGAHHMQAHLLTPRLVRALSPPPFSSTSATIDLPDRAPQPNFPLLTLLISGGHTMLLHSTDLTTHTLLANTTDLAAGNALDAIARLILPSTLLDAHTADTNYGPLLEKFAFPPSASTSASKSNPNKPIQYPTITLTRDDRGTTMTAKSKWGWHLPLPLFSSSSSTRSAGQNTGLAREMEFSFAGVESTVRRIVETGKAKTSEGLGRPREEEMGKEERRELAVQAMGAVFTIVADRVGKGLEMIVQERELEQGIGGNDKRRPREKDNIGLVLSGGVAANGFLREIIQRNLASRERNPEICVPPPALCTDNAAMIAWAGVEMWEAGWESELEITSMAKWPMGGGQILGAKGWKRRPGFDKEAR